MGQNGFTTPPKISDVARRYFEQEFSLATRDAMSVPASNDVAGWEKRCVEECRQQASYIEEVIEHYQPRLIETEIESVPVLDIRPEGWTDNHKVIVHTHGGAFVGGTARSALVASLPIAAESGLRIVSVDYIRAPRAQFNEITDEVVSVILGLLKQGYEPADIAIVGESAGGGLATAAALKIRDRGYGMLAAVVLWSPWVDVGCIGDSHITIRDEEPFYTKELFLSIAALAYAPESEHQNPYASPVYADYNDGFPPTLIQAGSREILLSDSIRLYQALDTAGQLVKLDLYEGMWHVFQFLPIEGAEARRARSKTCKFICEHLGVGHA